ncbi:hypothetical protein LguiB_022172 [Lonicera macranthoides]
MLRDFKFLRRNPGKNPNAEDIENVPVNPSDSSAPQTGGDSSRPPLNAIQEPVKNPRACVEHELGNKSTKADRTTPTKAKGRYSDGGIQLRTPEKRGVSAGNRFGWAQKNDSIESRDDSRVDLSSSTGLSSRGVGNVNTPRSNRGVGRANSGYSESNSTQCTPTKSVSKPPNPGLCLTGGPRPPPASGGARLANFAALSKGIPISCNSMTVVNTVEVPHFDLKEDPSFWMDHNIQVLIRVRPLNSMERSTQGYNRCLKQESAQCITWIGQPETRFTFDHVACETVDQETLFRMVGLPMVENCLSGYNSCMFAYGQTGSGKTYTMLGELDELEVRPSVNRGMTPRIFEFLFARIRALREDCKKGVYVENLSEFEVQTVGDILRLLSEGSSNRKVAATNMNRESSRSHSVFTCVIESKWEKDSTSNLRFARLNLVDLAGSERQKTSGAEGERLKEAANINKSLSTLGCAAETLNTLKFAQRAKLIQNNAVVNEDSSGDVIALQNQIRLLKEEVSALKRQHVSRSLSFGPAMIGDTRHESENGFNEKALDQQRTDDILGCESRGSLRVSSKQEICGSAFQLKSLETTLTGALRREQMTETSIKQLEAEIEQLNRLVNALTNSLVRQREEDSRCSKMMLKFREDKIQRMESLVGGLIPADAYLLDENTALSEEIQLLRAKVDRNPEVTRFALENIRLLEQLRRLLLLHKKLSGKVLVTMFINYFKVWIYRFQDFYEEGEREMLLTEVSELRDQVSMAKFLMRFCLHFYYYLDPIHVNVKTLFPQLASFLAGNPKQLNISNIDVPPKESILEAPSVDDQPFEAVPKEQEETHQTLVKHTDDETNQQLELDILKVIIKEERSSRSEMEEKALCLTRELELAQGKVLLITKQFEDVKEELKEAKSIIEALESQQLISIGEMEELRNINNYYAELSQKQDLEISSLKEQIFCQELRDPSPFNDLEKTEDSPLQAKLKKMQHSLEKAKRLNIWYQSDRTFNASNEEEMDKVRRQVEAETAEVIVCLQEELAVLQQQVHESNLKERETEGKLAFMETELKELQQKLEEKDKESKDNSDEWELLTSEIEVVLSDGHEVLKDASNQLDFISSSFPQKRTWISTQLGKMTRSISEKELIIEELGRCLEEANNRRNDMESMLRSLRGAALVITEAHQQDCCEKENEILRLTSQLSERASIVEDLEDKMKRGEEQIRKASNCATVAFVILNRLSEINCNYLEALKHKDDLLSNQSAVIVEEERKIESLRMELEGAEENCGKLEALLSEEKKRACDMELKLEELEENNILKAKEQVTQLKTGVSTLKSSMNEYADQFESQGKDISLKNPVCMIEDDKCKAWTGTGENQGVNNIESNILDFPFEENFARGSISKESNDRDTTIILLKKEIESALESLRGVQVEMAKLHDEKEQVSISEKQSRKGIESLMSQVLALQAALDNFEEQFQLTMVHLDDKLLRVEEITQEAGSSWCQEKELYELELGDAQIVATQKTAEASCILAKFEEAQDTMKEADIMINELMISNETMKLEIEGLKKKEVGLTNERDMLINNVQILQTANSQKDLHCKNLEKHLELELTEMKELVLELEEIVSQVQSAFNEDFLSLASDFIFMKSQLHDSNSLMRSGLEDIWSEIIVKDCALSVLHLCHMGILLETVTGLNAENGFLHHGLCESNSVISELREHNCKSRRELEMCRILKGKLLTDIKNSFDRVSRKADETGKLTVKLTSFEKKILDLELQEESMLQRSNYMGSELAMLMKELNASNRNILASLLDREKLLKDKDEILRCEEEKFMMDLYAKDLESFIFASELEQMAIQKVNVDEEQTRFSVVLENLKKDVVFLKVDAELKDLMLLDKETEVSVLCKEVEVAQKDLNIKNLEISKMVKANKTFEQDVQLLRDVSSSNDTLKNELHVLMEAKMRLSSHVQKLESEHERLLEDVKMKETALEISSNHISGLDQQNQTLQNDICLLEASFCKLQSELEMKDADLIKMSSLEADTESLKREAGDLKAEYCIVLQDLEVKKSENHMLQDKIFSLENCITNLQTDLTTTNVELNDLQLHQSVLKDELLAKIHDLEIHVDRVNTLKEENVYLRNDLRSHERNAVKCVNSVEAVDMVGSRVFGVLNKESVALEKMFQEICRTVERASKFIEEFESLENLAQELVCENSSLKTELERKDDVLEGLLFDLRLLQESASSIQDQKDEIEELVVSLDALENELAIRSNEFHEAVAKGQILEGQLQEKIGIISILESDLSKERASVSSLSSSNLQLTAKMEDTLKAKRSIEEDLIERMKENESLEMEVIELGRALDQMNNLIESFKSNLNSVTNERDNLHEEILILKEELEIAQAVAEENETIAMEARQVAETTKLYADDKEEEVRLLERSVEELECTVNVLENKADIVKGEAERQRLQREELELELQAVKQQMLNVKSSSDAEMKRHLDEKEKNLQESLQRIQILERELAVKDAEFKALEAMVEQVKPECSATHITNTSTNKLEKNGSKSRGSGSPFKCIGLGLAQQIKSERDEELSAGRQRIEELEALAVSRQKEIFMLNARLAAAESMTHDVIRDLLGLKLDMTNYASLLDNHQVQKIAEKARLHNAEAQNKDQEVIKLKQQLNAFVEERRGWLEEIERKQAEMVAAQIALEKLRQRDRLLTTENEMFKAAGVTRPASEISLSVAEESLEQLKNRVISLERELKDAKFENRISHEKIRLSELVPQSSPLTADENQSPNILSQTPFFSALDR